MTPLPYTTGAVTACAFSANNEAVILGTSEGFIEVLALSSGERLHSAKLFRHEVQTVALSPDNKAIIAGSSHGELALWQVNTQEKIALSRGSGSAHARSAFSMSGALAALSFTTKYHGHEGTTLYLIQGEELLLQTFYRKANCQGLWFLDEALCALIDGKVERINENLKRSKWLSLPQTIFAFSPTDNALVVGAQANHSEEISLLTSGTASPRRLLNSLARQTYFISYTQQLVVALEHLSETSRMRCFSYQGELLRDQEIDGFRFFFCGATARLLACSLSEEVTLYHLKEGTCGLTLRPKNTISLRAFVFHRDASVALLSYEEDLGLVLHTKNKAPQYLPDSAGCRAAHLLVSADASCAALLDWSGQARVWDLNSQLLLARLPFFQPDETRGIDLPSALLSFDGSFLASTVGAFRLFSTQEQREITTPHFEPIPAIHTEAEDALEDPSAEGSWLPAAYQACLLPGGKGVALYHKEVGSLLFAFGNGERRSLLGRGVSGCAGFDLDWQWAALASSRQAKLLSLQSGEEYAIPRPHKTRPLNIIFSPTAERLALITGKSNSRESSSKTRLQLPSYDDTAISYLRNTQGDIIALHEMTIELYSVVSKSLQGTLTLHESFSFIGMSDDGKDLYLEVAGELRRYHQKRHEYELQERAFALPAGRCLWQSQSKAPPAPQKATAPTSATLLEAIAARATLQQRSAQLSTSVGPRLRLSKASLPRVNLEEANLSWAELRQADLRGSNLRRATLSGADLSGARLDGANLVGAKLSGVRIERASLFEADLRWAEIPIKALNTAAGALRFLPKPNAPIISRLALSKDGEHLTMLYATSGKLYLSQLNIKKRTRSLYTETPEDAELLLSDDGAYLWLLGTTRLLAFHRGVQRCDVPLPQKRKKLTSQQQSQQGVLSSDGATLWYASETGLHSFSCTTQRGNAYPLPGTLQAPLGKLTRYQSSLALWRPQDEHSGLLWCWREGSSPKTQKTISGLQHPIEHITQVSPQDVILVDRELRLSALSIENSRLTHLGACYDINNHACLSIQGQTLFAAETTPSLWDLSGKRRLQALSSPERTSFCPFAVISSNQTKIASIQSACQSVLLWEVPKDSPAVLWPSLRLWPLPDGEFLFYQQDGAFIASKRAHEHLWVRWPNGELSSLDDPRVKRWRKS